MRLRLILGLTLLLAAQPATAEDSFFDRLFRGRSDNTPPNPFASNYPSAPPSRETIRDERERRAARGARPAPESGPVPPGRIPE